MNIGKGVLNGLLVLVLMGCLIFSKANAQNMTIWKGQWFNITGTDKGYTFENSMFISENEKASAYLKITDWDSVNKVLKGKGYLKKERTWGEQNWDHHYITGTDLDFLCFFDVEMEGGLRGYTARITGKIKGDGALSSATIKSLGGYYWETGEFERAGAFTVTGKWIPESKLPPDIPK